MNNPTEQMTPAQTYLAVNRDRIQIAIIKFNGKLEYHYLASREIELSPGEVVVLERDPHDTNQADRYYIGTVVAARGLELEDVFTNYRYKWVVAKIESSKDSQMMAAAVEKITKYRLTAKLTAMTDAIPHQERELASPVTEIPAQFQATQMGTPIDTTTTAGSDMQSTDLYTALRSGRPFRRSSCPHNDGEPGVWMETSIRADTRINGPLTAMQLFDESILVRYVDGHEARVKVFTDDERLAQWDVWTGDGKPV